jgi:glyceraldehyde 3-phosphate dehydrogenase
MTKRIAINGFGRVGRAAYRIIHERRKAGETDLEVVAINDLTDNKTLAHLLKRDTVHRTFGADVSYTETGLVVDGKTIAATAERDPAKLPWKANEVDVVLESTGVFRNKEKCQGHLDAGARKVLISAPAKGDVDATVCFGINNEDYDASHTVVSTASCTTNCLAPVAKVLHDNWGIDHALMTTIHAYTNDQRILDLPHRDLRRARAAAQNMIPTTTGAAAALALVIPEMKGKFDGMAIRVPTMDVSLVDLTVKLDKSATADEVNAKLKEAAEGKYDRILGYTEEPLVSSDFLGTNESSIVDALSTKVIGDNLLKVLSWYDNEWGFTNRAVDLLNLLAD